MTDRRFETAANLSRRQFMIQSVAAAAAASAFLAACQSAKESPSGGASASRISSTFPVSIDHTQGTTVIPAEPQRVVALGYSDQDPMLALGVVPVGIRDWLEQYPGEIAPWQQPALAGATPEVLGYPIPFEQLAALAPDLITACYEAVKDQQYAKLSKIAPTVANDPKYDDYTTPWQEMHRTIATSLGMAPQMDTLIQDVEGQLAQATQDHPEFQGKTALALSSGFGDESQFGVYTGQDPRVTILAALGFGIPPAVENELDPKSYFTFLSMERIDLLDDADALLWLAYTDKELEYVTSDPGYQQLTAVKEGRDIFGSKDLTSSLSFASVLSIPFALNELVPALSAAIDGDPSTTA